MQVTRILSFSLNILCLFGIYDCNKNYRNFSENFYNLAVTSGHVYIGGNHSLIQLNSTLDEVKVIPLNGKNWLLTPYDNKIGETIIISCTFLHIEGFKVRCIGLNASELAPVDGFIGNVVTVKKLTSVKYVTTLIGTDPKVNTLTIASSGCLQNGGTIFECLAISNYQQNMDILESHTVRYLVDGNGNLDLKSDIIIDFKSVVVHRHSTYFLFRLKNTVSKLGKMCTKELHSIQQDSNNINTYEDLRIYCTDYNGVKYTIAEDMVFWNDHLLVTFNDGVGSVVCKFTDISNSFKTSRQDKFECPYKETTNQYFQKPPFKLCYSKNNATCQSFNGQVSMNKVLRKTAIWVPHL